MPGTIQINMPMKPYLRKFLLKKYGNTYKISFYSLLGKFFLEILDKQYRKGDGKIRSSSSYTFIIPKTIVEKVGFDMPPQKMKRFEEMLESLFKSELEAHIDLTVEFDLYVNINDKNYKLDVMKAMKQFLDFYKINEDELKLESVYRSYQRNKKDVGHKSTKALN